MGSIYFENKQLELHILTLRQHLAFDSPFFIRLIYFYGLLPLEINKVVGTLNVAEMISLLNAPMLVVCLLHGIAFAVDIFAVF